MNRIIRKFEYANIFDSRIGLVRTAFAISALSILLFNDVNIMTNKALFEDHNITNNLNILTHYNIFSLLGNTTGYILSLSILFLSIIGFFPKITIFLQAYIQLSIVNSFLIIEGGDQLVAILLLLLIPIVLLDSRKNHWRLVNNDCSEAKNKYKNVFANCMLFLIRIQIAIVYFHAAVGKLRREDWLDGTCMHYWVTSNIFGIPTFMEKIVTFFTLSNFAPIIAWGTIIFEVCLFANLFTTSISIRRFFLITAILFHFLIVLTFGLITFFFAMLGALLLYLDFENSIGKKTIYYAKKFQNKIFKNRNNGYHIDKSVIPDTAV